MPPLSALDAIVPAWVHTRRLLLDRRDWRLLLKLTAVALLAELGGGFGFNLGTPGRPGHGLPPQVAAVVLPLLLLFGLIGLVIGLVLFYVGSRLQFALFHVVLRGETLMAPIWERYGPATWRWMGVKLLLVLAALACLLPPGLPLLLLLVHAVPHGAGVPKSHGTFFLGMVGLLGLAALVILLAAAMLVLLRDFGLPSMALEATPLRETIRRIVALVRLEPAQTALFVLMRFVLGLAMALGAYFALFVLALVAAIPLGGAGLGLWGLFHHGAASGEVVMVAGWALLGIVYAIVLVVAAVVLFGYGFTFLQAFAIFFLAGRYPLLASQLQVLPPRWEPKPAWPPAFYPPPQPPIV